MLMILLLHLAVAFASIAATTISFFRPSHTKIRASYALIGLTLLSGTYLVVKTQSHMLEACLSGLVYLAFVSAGILIARQKLNQSEGLQD